MKERRGGEGVKEGRKDQKTILGMELWRSAQMGRERERRRNESAGAKKIMCWFLLLGAGAQIVLVFFILFFAF